ncbi:hypothetical protein [Kineosporia babensis]|uniref:Uncharacterized protein n=1 Tax=Kineosporia babensis TaxID=499548 RepID=A0A9X1NJN3_9ACTN|nr:hypothetical protein [Kineosporia babensis]MCD5316232.1 hypothetical protein [Kineosporia babensis]
MSDGVDIKLERLRESAAGLARVKNQLEGARNTANYDAWMVSQPDLASALGEFSDNWKANRESLTRATEGAHRFVTFAVGKYEELEKALTEAITPESGGAK